MVNCEMVDCEMVDEINYIDHKITKPNNNLNQPSQFIISMYLLIISPIL